MNTEEEKPKPMVLAEGGAMDVWVSVDDDDEFIIGDNSFTKVEAIKIRDFINEWVGSGE